MTLDEILHRNAERFPDKAAFIMDDVLRTWRETDVRVTRLANALLEHRVRSGDRVAVLLPNCPEYFEIYFGCARAGVIAVPLNYRLTPRELAQILVHADPSLLIVGTEYLLQVTELHALLPNLCRLWVVGEKSMEGARAYEEMLSAGSSQWRPRKVPDTDPCAIFYTSGTTGLPKGAMVSHVNLEMNGYNQMVADRSRRDDINLVATPVYHIGAVFMSVTYMMLGCTQVLLPRFQPALWLQTLARRRATVALLVPTLVNAVLHDPHCAGADLSSLRLTFYGGGPMPTSVLEQAMQTLRCSFTQGYGLTETLEATFLTFDDHVLDGNDTQRARLASAGREAVGAEIRIVDTTGNDVPPGEMGEILVKSRSVIAGYWKMPEESARVIRNGWFHTGDVGYLDPDRYLFVVDRIKDMVISGGVNIYTKEIEGVLYQHPSVMEVAIIGLPDEKWGEVVTAIVARKPNTNVTAEELVEHCRAALASYKKPRHVFFVDELPKNPSGKVLKRELRTRFAAQAGQA
jgi:long-chain acyl-CoA synthetase